MLSILLIIIGSVSLVFTILMVALLMIAGGLRRIGVSARVIVALVITEVLVLILGVLAHLFNM